MVITWRERPRVTRLCKRRPRDVQPALPLTITPGDVNRVAGKESLITSFHERRQQTPRITSGTHKCLFSKRNGPIKDFSFSRKVLDIIVRGRVECGSHSSCEVKGPGLLGCGSSFGSRDWRSTFYKEQFELFVKVPPPPLYLPSNRYCGLCIFSRENRVSIKYVNKKERILLQTYLKTGVCITRDYRLHPYRTIYLSLLLLLLGQSRQVQTVPCLPPTIDPG